MKKKLFILCILALLLSLSASFAMACNCGKKVDGSSHQDSTYQAQHAGGCGGQSACSDDSFQLAQGTMPPEGKEGEAKAVEAGNKICPVSGHPVDDGKMGEAIKYEYNGKIYNLCCKMCVKDFQKDPEKYSKIAQDEVEKVNEQANVKEDKDDSKEHEGDDDVEMHQHNHSP